jgi:hypothetical protein
MLYDPAELLAAQGLLQPGKALLLAQVRRIEHMHALTATKSVDLVSLVVRALKSLGSNNLDDAECLLTELLAVLISENLEMNQALGFELTVRDDAHKVQTLATQILLGEADDFPTLGWQADSPIEMNLEHLLDDSGNDNEFNQ